MADNIQLNPGVNGAVVRTFADADGAEWQAVVPSYATTLADGANVLQVVTPSNGLPVTLTSGQTIIVSQGTAANLKVLATIDGTPDIGTVSTITNPVAVTQSGDWSFTLDSVAATQSGTWNINSITNAVAVTQSGTWDFGDLTLASGQSIEVTQATAANLKATVSIASAQTLANVTTVGSITNPVAATQSGSWTTAVTQATASNLNTTATLAAGSALIGKASAGQDSSTIYDGTTALTPKFAVINASSSGNTQVVAAVSGKHIRVLRWNVTSSGAVNAALRTGTTTPISGLKYLIASASGGGAFCPVGICQTRVNEALNINLSAAVAVSGELTYVEV